MDYVAFRIVYQDHRPSCTPSTPRTYLLAYSTDLDFAKLQFFFDSLYFDLSETPLWNTYANVRLDMKNGDDIRYFNDLESFNQSLNSNPPDPTLGYMDNTTGSDMLDVLKKFLENTDKLCGSTVVITAKRYPNEVELENLISDLQKNHVFVYVFSSDTPSGGSNPSAMFNLATRTNGYCVFSAESYLENMYINAKYLAFIPIQIIAIKFAVSGTGRQTIPFKMLGNPGGVDYVEFETVFQDHKVDGSLISLNYTLADEFGNKQSSPNPDDLTAYTGSSLYFRVNNTVQYYLSIDYEYEEGREEVLVVRAYSTFFIPDNWLPFDN
ncbi:unnamed protein product [Caenorhabditis brenneri]